MMTRSQGRDPTAKVEVTVQEDVSVIEMVPALPFVPSTKEPLGVAATPRRNVATDMVSTTVLVAVSTTAGKDMLRERKDVDLPAAHRQWHHMERAAGVGSMLGRWGPRQGGY